MKLKRTAKRAAKTKRLPWRGFSKLKRPTKKKNNQPEYELQCALVAWFELQYPGALFCASAGGMRTTIRTAVKMRKAGYRKGFPDLFIYEPRGGHNGLAIELKAEGGHVSEHQSDWLLSLCERNYYACACFDLRSAQEVINHYFKLYNTSK